MRARAFFLVLVLTVILYSCESRQDETIVNLGFRAVVGSEQTVMTARSSAAEGLLIDTAIIILENISLTQDGESNAMVATGPSVINLLTKSSNPPVSTSGVQPGTYSGLEAQLVVPENTGFSINITGTYTLDDKWWRFRYLYTKEGGFSVNSEQDVTVNELQVNNIWVLIDVVSLFRGVNFPGARTNSSNVIVISDVSNTALAAIIESNFKTASTITNNTQPGGGTTGDSSKENDEENDNNGSQGSGGGGNDKNKDKDKDKDKEKDKDKDKDGGNKDKDDDDDDDDEDDEDDDDDDKDDKDDDDDDGDDDDDDDDDDK